MMFQPPDTIVRQILDSFMIHDSFTFHVHFMTSGHFLGVCVCDVRACIYCVCKADLRRQTNVELIAHRASRMTYVHTMETHASNVQAEHLQYTSIRFDFIVENVSFVAELFLYRKVNGANILSSFQHYDTWSSWCPHNADQTVVCIPSTGPTL